MYNERPISRAHARNVARMRARAVATGVAIGDLETDQAFEGCTNRLRVAAVVGGARFTGTMQGVAIGIIVGTLVGAIGYIVAERAG